MGCGVAPVKVMVLRDLSVDVCFDSSVDISFDGPLVVRPYLSFVPSLLLCVPALQYGKVYKGLWHGTVVAVKAMVLHSNMSGAEKYERMAIMEAAISSSLSHPNIVQV